MDPSETDAGRVVHRSTGKCLLMDERRFELRSSAAVTCWVARLPALVNSRPRRRLYRLLPRYTPIGTPCSSVYSTVYTHAHTTPAVDAAVPTAFQRRTQIHQHTPSQLQTATPLSRHAGRRPYPSCRCCRRWPNRSDARGATRIAAAALGLAVQATAGGGGWGWARRAASAHERQRAIRHLRGRSVAVCYAW